MTAELSRPCRLAMCDDAPQLLRLLGFVFEVEEGIELVGTAGDGAEVIDLCRREQPDVLLLDVAMPVRDGIDALPDILAASPDTQVVVYTGFASPEIERRALGAGAVEVLLKGMAPPALVERVLQVHRSGVGSNAR